MLLCPFCCQYTAGPMPSSQKCLHNAFIPICLYDDAVLPLPSCHDVPTPPSHHHDFVTPSLCCYPAATIQPLLSRCPLPTVLTQHHHPSIRMLPSQCCHHLDAPIKMLLSCCHFTTIWIPPSCCPDATVLPS